MDWEDLVAFLGFVLVATLLAFVGNYVGPYFRNYRLGRKGVEFVWFGKRLRTRRIPYHRIREARVVSWWEATRDHQFAVAAGNRLTRRGVLIRRKWWPPVLITPDDPEGFVRELRRRVHRETGQRV